MLEDAQSRTTAGLSLGLGIFLPARRCSHDEDVPPPCACLRFTDPPRLPMEYKSHRNTCQLTHGPQEKDKVQVKCMLRCDWLL